jgi:hypothetical protein
MSSKEDRIQKKYDELNRENKPIEHWKNKAKELRIPEGQLNKYQLMRVIATKMIEQGSAESSRTVQTTKTPPNTKTPPTKPPTYEPQSKKPAREKPKTKKGEEEVKDEETEAEDVAFEENRIYGEDEINDMTVTKIQEQFAKFYPTAKMNKSIKKEDAVKQYLKEQEKYYINQFGKLIKDNTAPGNFNEDIIKFYKFFLDSTNVAEFMITNEHPRMQELIQKSKGGPQDSSQDALIEFVMTRYYKQQLKVSDFVYLMAKNPTMAQEIQEEGDDPDVPYNIETFADQLKEKYKNGVIRAYNVKSAADYKKWFEQQSKPVFPSTFYYGYDENKVDWRHDESELNALRQLFYETYHEPEKNTEVQRRIMKRIENQRIDRDTMFSYLADRFLLNQDVRTAQKTFPNWQNIKESRESARNQLAIESHDFYIGGFNKEKPSNIFYTYLPYDPVTNLVVGTIKSGEQQGGSISKQPSPVSPLAIKKVALQDISFRDTPGPNTPGPNTSFQTPFTPVPRKETKEEIRARLLERQRRESTAITSNVKGAENVVEGTTAKQRLQKNLDEREYEIIDEEEDEIRRVFPADMRNVSAISAQSAESFRSATSDDFNPVFSPGQLEPEPMPGQGENRRSFVPALTTKALDLTKEKFGTPPQGTIDTSVYIQGARTGNTPSPLRRMKFLEERELMESSIAKPVTKLSGRFTTDTQTSPPPPDLRNELQAAINDLEEARNDNLASSQTIAQLIREKDEVQQELIAYKGAEKLDKQQRLTEVRQQKQEKERIEKELKAQRDEIANQKDEIARLKSVEDNLKTKESELAALQTKLDQETKLRNISKTRNDSLTTEIASYKSREATLIREKEQLQRDLASSEINVRLLKQQNTTGAENVEAIKKATETLNAQLATANSRLTEFESKTPQLVAERNRLKEDLETAKKQLQELDKELDEKVQRFRDLDVENIGLKQTNTQLKQSIEGLEYRIQQNNEDIKAFNEQIMELTEANAKLTEQYDEIIGGYTEYQEFYQKNQKIVENYKLLQEDHQKISAELEQSKLENQNIAQALQEEQNKNVDEDMNSPSSRKKLSTEKFAAARSEILGSPNPMNRSFTDLPAYNPTTGGYDVSQDVPGLRSYQGGRPTPEQLRTMTFNQPNVGVGQALVFAPRVLRPAVNEGLSTNIEKFLDDLNFTIVNINGMAGGQIQRPFIINGEPINDYDDINIVMRKYDLKWEEISKNVALAKKICQYAFGENGGDTDFGKLNTNLKYAMKIGAFPFKYERKEGEKREAKLQNVAYLPNQGMGRVVDSDLGTIIIPGQSKYSIRREGLNYVVHGGGQKRAFGSARDAQYFVSSGAFGRKSYGPITERIFGTPMKNLSQAIY